MKIVTTLSAMALALTAASVPALTITYLDPPGIVSGNINSAAGLIADLGSPPVPAGEVMWDKSDGGGIHDADFTSTITGSNLPYPGPSPYITFHYVGDPNAIPNINYGSVKAGDFHIDFQITGWNGEDIVLYQDKILNP